jgi:glycosyltransferase involved in cell wall biosynthesis
LRADAGVIVAPGDYSGFVRSVFGLVQDAEVCTTYARNARQYAEREFAIDQIAGRFENVFNDAVRGKR